MVVYTCDICLRSFNRKSSYTDHINRKNKCIPSMASQNADIVTLNSILDELKKVKQVNQKILKENKEFKKFKSTASKITKENNELKRRIKMLESGPKLNNNKKTTINGDIINGYIVNGDVINNSSYVNVNVVAFGKEKIDIVTEDLNHMIQGNKTFSNMVDYFYFNVNKPENHNVYISNRKNKNEVFIFDGKKWKIADRQRVISYLLDQNISYVEGKLKELELTLSKSKINALSRAIDAYNDSDHEYHKSTTQKITNDVELILYNNRDIIKKTHNIK